MSEKIARIYDALIEGAEKGLIGDGLFKHVVDACPKASSKKIVKASLLALSDPDVKDAAILHVVYALAIKHRLDPASKDDIEEIGEKAAEMPSVKKAKASKKPAETTAN